MAIINTINNRSSYLTLDPGSTGDPYVQFDINTTSKYILGVDDSDADKFKIATGSSLGSNNTFVITANGEVTKPLQSAFLAVRGSTLSNVTGDGTVYTVPFTEIFDQNSDFSSTTFTAPVTGRYQFDCAISCSDLTTSHNDMELAIVTSNRTYTAGLCDPGAIKSGNDNTSAEFSVLADMDASDTAHVTITVSGSTKIIDVISNGGTTDTNAWFSGNLQC